MALGASFKSSVNSPMAALTSLIRERRSARSARRATPLAGFLDALGGPGRRAPMRNGMAKGASSSGRRGSGQSSNGCISDCGGVGQAGVSGDAGVARAAGVVGDVDVGVGGMCDVGDIGDANDIGDLGVNSSGRSTSSDGCEAGGVAICSDCACRKKRGCLVTGGGGVDGCKDFAEVGAD